MDLTFDNYFSGGVYYTVTINEDHKEGDAWYHQSFQDVDAWCTETFGEHDIWGNEPSSGWKRMRNVYFFTDKSKKDWFVVRWS